MEGSTPMKNKAFWLIPLLGILIFAVLASAQSNAIAGEGRAIVTVLPKSDGQLPPAVLNNDVGVKVNGKVAKVTEWKRLDSPDDRVELVVLIDSAARTSIGNNLEEVGDFFNHLPPNVQALVGYMSNGRNIFTGQFTSDADTLKHMLHLPNGSIGANGSPYFCLSDLARNWPSKNKNVRRIVVMITDGVDPYHGGIGSEDSYVKSAMDDSARANIVVYTIYWKDKGLVDNTAMGDNYGQNQLSTITESTGGRNFWNGFGDPTDFTPFFDKLTRLLRNQYELRFVVPLKNKPEVETLRVKLSAPGAEVDVPQEVYVYPAPVEGLK